jgi:hypothetical protein
MNTEAVLDLMNAFGKGKDDSKWDSLLPEIMEDYRSIIKRHPNLEYNDFDYFDEDSWSLIEAEYNDKPISMVREVFNSMIENKKMFWPLMVKLADSVTEEQHYQYDSVTNNVLLQCNVLTPMVRLLNQQKFRFEFLKHWETCDDLAIIELILEEGMEDFLDSLIRLSRKRELGNEDKETIRKKCVLIKSVQNRLNDEEINKLLDSDNPWLELKKNYLNNYEEHKKIYDDFLDLFPDTTFSAMELLFNSGITDEEMGRLYDFEPMYKSMSLYFVNLGFGTSLAKDIVLLWTLLFGDFDTITSGECGFAYEILRKGCIAIGREPKEVTSIHASGLPFDVNKTVHFVTHTGVYQIQESTIPFFKGSIDSLVNSIFSNIGIMDIQYKTPGRDKVGFSCINFIPRLARFTIKPYDYGFKTFKLDDFFSAMTLEKLQEILSEMLMCAKQISCYDPYICFIVRFMIRHSIDMNKWFPMLSSCPGIFVTAFMSLAVMCELECNDYEWVLSKQNAMILLEFIAKNYAIGCNVSGCVATTIIKQLIKDHGTNVNVQCTFDCNTPNSFVVYKKEDTLRFSVQEILDDFKSVYGKISYQEYDTNCSVNLSDGSVVFDFR